MPNPDSRECLHQLLSHSWSEYDRLKNREYVARPAIPMLFFGDSGRYLSSPLKVVTVELNPAIRDLSESDRQSLFPAEIDAAKAGAGQLQFARRLAALDSYFRRDPFREWFANIEPILNGMRCSFYDGAENTALHTDLCSPVSTFSAWRNFSRQQRIFLEFEGERLWHSLIHALAPDIILVSVARRYLNQLQFHSVGASEIIWRQDGVSPYEVTATPIEVRQSMTTLLVVARATPTPFGAIPVEMKKEVGATIKARHAALCRSPGLGSMRRA